MYIEEKYFERVCLFITLFIFMILFLGKLTGSLHPADHTCYW